MAGVALYSYAAPDVTRDSNDSGERTADGFLWDLLTRPSPDNEFSPPFGLSVGSAPGR